MVKGRSFENLVDQGDPVARALAYERDGADEICMLDISASNESRLALLEVVRRVARGLSIPLVVGGGVRSVDDMGALLAAGADRVSINTGAVEDPDLITRCARRFGRQAVVVAIDARRGDGRYGIETHGARRARELSVVDWIREADRRGAGEFLLTSIDQDGRQAGYDLELLAVSRAATRRPIIASGGAGDARHVADALAQGADAALLASILHEGRHRVSDIKAYLVSRGEEIRGA